MWIIINTQLEQLLGLNPEAQLLITNYKLPFTHYSMPEKPKSLESQLQMARPRRSEVKRVPLTVEEKEFLGEIMDKAVAAEKAGDLEKALGFYSDYKNELLKIKGKKEGEKIFELKEQYEDQIETLKQNGLIKELPSGEMGFVDIKDQLRPIPSYDDILKKVEAKKELLEKKKEQGFTQFLIVPFGMKLSDMIEKAKELILKKYEEGNLKGTNGNYIGIDDDNPVYMNGDYKEGNADISGDLVYFPEKYDQENHGGKTKKEILKETDGWDIMFIEDMPDLPAEGKGKTIGNRKQLEANESPNEYLEKMQKEEQYKGESGMTPEGELTYFMHYLQRNNKVIDDFEGSGKVNLNLGGYLKTSGGVCLSFWNLGTGRMGLGWDSPGGHNANKGVRSSARI